MKLRNLLLGLTLIASTATFAQDDQQRECDRMLYLAQLARLEKKDYKESTTYMLKAEKICGTFEKKNMDILIASIRNAQMGLTDDAAKKAYADTLSAAYDRAEAAGMYESSEDLIRAANELGTTNPDRAKADKLFKGGIKTYGEKTHEGYISLYYYNLYYIYTQAPSPEKKKELISEYFAMAALAGKANMSAQTTETLLSYFNALVKSCDDIIPDLKVFIKELPQEKEAKISTINNFIKVLEAKECTESDEYFQLIDTLVSVDPSAISTLIKKGDGEVARKKYSDGIATYKRAIGLATEDAMKNELQYKIAHAYYKSGSYSTAYSQAMSVGGEFKGKALVIAANSVASNANNCGSSTFERKCNYIYAAQLLEQAGQSGGSMRSKGPSSEECFDNGNPSSVTLSCYGVSVSPCN